ncbi:hypothetical protein ETB97_006244 [Aspergillus alliaceus]|uniref:Extracellular membrane protein CFEM domain-containing protein n=1 Tax=Petromyces alliaceus TaxID=209559 RepID=A0A8H6E2N2_PETAA|nr:hypothetical protein ETB97_006244 [Aspergillus burnettii]
MTVYHACRDLLIVSPKYEWPSSARDDEQEGQFTTYLLAIPHCALKCMDPQFLAHKCAHSDYACICTRLTSIGTEPEFEFCMNNCSHNPDQRWEPDRILDLCDLMDIKPVHPDYMATHTGLHRRQSASVPVITSIITTSETDTGRMGPATVFLTQTETLSYLQPTMISTTSDATVVIRSTDTGAPTTTSSGTQTATPTATAITSDVSGTNNTSSGFSKGAKAGIGVAVPSAIILIAALLWFLRRRRLRSKSRTADVSEVIERQPPMGPGPVCPVAKDGMPLEIDGNAIHESGGRAIEHSSAPSPVPVYELSGETVNSPSKEVAMPASGEKGSPVQDIRETGPGCSHLQPSETDDAHRHKVSDMHPSNSPEERRERESAIQYENMDIGSLEEEISRVRKRKERLQYLQSLEEQEELLKQAVARKRGTSE